MCEEEEACAINMVNSVVILFWLFWKSMCLVGVIDGGYRIVEGVARDNPTEVYRGYVNQYLVFIQVHEFKMFCGWWCVQEVGENWDLGLGGSVRGGFFI